MAERLMRRVEESLRAAAKRGDIEGLYASIKEDPTVLDRIDAVPFVETPLHVAASTGQELFAIEILRLKPSFGPKLNPDGLSSLHMALKKRKFNMVIVLIELDKQLIRVKGKEGETPLHLIVKNEDIDHVEADQEQRVEGNVNGGQHEDIEHVEADQEQRVEGNVNGGQHEDIDHVEADQEQRVEGNVNGCQHEDIDHVEADQEQRVEGNVNGGQQEGEDPRILILAELLFACPNSIEDRTIREETALHIAVRNNNKHVVEVIVGFIFRTEMKWVLDARDFEGNTVLHMAVSNSQLEMVKRFIWIGVNINIKNYVAKKTALDIALLSRTDEARLIEKSLRDAGAKTSSPSVNDNSLAKFLMSSEQASDVLYKDFLFAKREMSTEKRNLGLVVAVLIATTTFQVVLKPPGGQGGGNDQLLRNGTYISANVSSTNYPFAASNTSFVNATLFAPTYDPDVALWMPFYFWNATAFYSSVLMIAVFLRDTIFFPLHLALASLASSYLTSLLLVMQSGNLYVGFQYIPLFVVIFSGINRFPMPASMEERFRRLQYLLTNYI